jgi:hypothetical protein
MTKMNNKKIVSNQKTVSKNKILFNANNQG